MARKPANKAINNTNLGGITDLYRQIAPFVNYENLFDANSWRAIARSQPIVSDCISTIKMHIQSLPFSIRARDANKSDELKDSIEYHLEILDEAQLGLGFLAYLDLLLEDYLVTPFGAATATPRYSDGKLYKIYSVDAGTLRPFNDPNWYVIQIVPEAGMLGGYNSGITPIFFNSDELVRMFSSPRPELLRYGWGIAPPERIFLALEMLNRGDRYYAQLLLDTPEAGLLDLGDMSKDAADKWLASFRNMFTGIDAFKIPVLYEHTVQAKYIPFNRPPTEMMFDNITFRYAELVCSAFGITTSDIGLKGSGGNSLGQAIRDQRHALSTGYSSVKKQIENHINKFLPKELQFWFVDTDDETLVAKGRARSANAVAMRNFIESGTLTPEEARQQMKADGLITIPLPEKVNPEDFEIVKDISGLNDQLAIQEQQLQLNKKTSGGSNVNVKGGQAGFSLNKKRNVRGGKLEQITGKDNVPASGGGMGEIKSLSSDEYKYLKQVLIENFKEVKKNVTIVRARRLIKNALKNYYPIAKSAYDENDYDQWKELYVKSLFEDNSDELVQRSIKGITDELGNVLQKDKWWEIQPDITQITETLSFAYLLGLSEAARQIHNSLYEEGYTNNSELDIKFNSLNDESSLKFLDTQSERIVNQVNDGTVFYISRMALMSVANSLGYEYFSDISNEEELTKLSNDDDLIDLSANDFVNNMNQVFDERIDTISELESTRIFNSGYLKQMSYVGFENKMLVHRTMDIPCETCQRALDAGLVPLDYEYETKFGSQTSKEGILHPNDHCELSFDKNELDKIRNNYFTGER